MVLSTTTILIIGGGLALLLLIIGIIVSISSESSMVEERLGRYVDTQSGNAAQDSRDIGGPVREWMNRRVERSSYGNKISRDLARADIKLKPGEYVFLLMVSIVLVAAIGYVLSGQAILMAVLGGIAGIFLPGMYVKRQQNHRLQKFSDQLPDMLNLMVNGLRAGYSTMQAMEAVSRELPAPISDEFRRVVQEMQLGISMEKALANLLVRIPSDDLDLLITAINVQREVGGNLAEILDTISFTIRERVRIKGEIRVLTTQQAYSGRFLALMPIIVILALYFLNREYIETFFLPENVPCGYIALGVASILIITGYFAMMKLAEIEI